MVAFGHGDRADGEKESRRARSGGRRGGLVPLETGASGQRYSREYVWSVLRERLASGEADESETGHWTMADEQVRERRESSDW
jgi:hypothetical protein